MADLQLRSLHRERPRPCFRNREPDHRSLEKRLPGETVRAAAGSPDGFIACAAVRDGNVAGVRVRQDPGGGIRRPGRRGGPRCHRHRPRPPGEGIGKAVLAEMERRMKARGIGTLRTQVDWDLPRWSASSPPQGSSCPAQVLERDASRCARRSGRWGARGGRAIPGARRREYYEALSATASRCAR